MYKRWDNIIKKYFGQKTKITFPIFFESKKNQVTLLELESDGFPIFVIAKYFVWGNIKYEWDILNKAHSIGLKVPKPITKNQNIAFMEYIPGKNLKIISQNNLKSLNSKSIGKWIAQFHKGFSVKKDQTLLKGDSMLPNFILHKYLNVLYGIDFEECRYGNPWEDISCITTSLLLLNKKNNLNYPKASQFIKAYLNENQINFSEKLFLKYICESLQKRTRFVPRKKNILESHINFIKNNPKEFIRDLKIQK